MKIKINRLYKGCIDIRDYVLKDCYSKKEVIEIVVENRIGKMILTPNDIKTKVVRGSKLFKSNFKNKPSYKLISYKWEPITK